MKKSKNKVGFSRSYALEPKLKIDLSVSENPLGCSRVVKEEFINSSFNFSQYPDSGSSNLASSVAKKFGLKKSMVFVGSGSESIIVDLMRILIFPDDEVIIPKLTFPMFEAAVEIAGGKTVSSKMDNNLKIDLDDIRSKVGESTKLIALCNPNNPTGNVLKKIDLIRFIRSVPKNIKIIVDEANIDFGGDSIIEATKKFDNLIVLRTFSKGFGLAMIRVGFCVSSNELISLLKNQTQPFPVSGISEKLAIAAMKDEDFLRKTKRFMNFQRKKLVVDLRFLGFRVFPSDANNIFVRIPPGLNCSRFNQKMAESGISVVRGSSFKGYDDSFLRICPRVAKTNQKFIKEISKIIKELKC